MGHSDDSVALLLMGGGSYGAYQAGQLKRIAEVAPNRCHIVSSSVGSINATQFLAGDIEKMMSFWLNIKTRDIYTDNKLLDIALSFKRSFLHDTKPLRRFLEANVDYSKLKNIDCEWWINATDLTNGAVYSRESKSLNRDDLITMVLASASPPVYFPTVKFDGRELCDSGVVNNFGITQAIDLGCKTLILLMPSKPSLGGKSRNILDLLGKVLGLSMNTYLEREARAIRRINEEVDYCSMIIERYNSIAPDHLDIPNKSRNIKLVMVYPEHSRSFNFLDFDFKGLDRKAILNHGYERAAKILEKELGW
jgi:predicted acylesterase/phospholipase RssA